MEPSSSDKRHSITEGTDEGPKLLSCGSFAVSWVSARDPLKQVNEDGAVVIDLGDRGLVACAVDGMGGMASGAEAAAITVECVLAAFAGEVESRRSALVDGFEAANERVARELKGAGATAVAVLVDPEFVQTIHAGDAEALVMGQRGKLKFRTVAHSPVGYAIEAGLLDEESAMVHPERHFVSNGIGLEGMQIQIGPRIELSVKDTIMLCSDGVTDNAFEAEIIDALRRGALEESTKHLFDLCRHRAVEASEGRVQAGTPGKSDDITLITIRKA
ncbi:MAG: serine/threonine protein phosphatase PrpC [Planctomycetota bacterium]|jgi:serine/threonine protein phosphatase PrpC